MTNWRRTYNYRLTVEKHGDRWLQHLRIFRHDRKAIRCTWDILQRIKNDAVGESVAMVEVFPPTDQVVNEVNYRHMYELPQLDFGLHLR